MEKRKRRVHKLVEKLLEKLLEIKPNQKKEKEIESISELLFFSIQFNIIQYPRDLYLTLL